MNTKKYPTWIFGSGELNINLNYLLLISLSKNYNKEIFLTRFLAIMDTTAPLLTASFARAFPIPLEPPVI
jgi:hypothetical protein